MTKEELATLLGTTRQNLNKWEKERPDLVRLINLGLSVEDQIDEARRHLEKLEAIRDQATSSNKFKLK